MDKLCYLLAGVVAGVAVYKCVCDKKKAKEQKEKTEQRRNKKCQCILTPYEYKCN